MAFLAVTAAGVGGLPRAAAVTKHAGLHNVSPDPWFWEACDQDGADSASCTRLAVAAIDHARAAEGVPALVLPDNYRDLSLPAQTFVVIDLERVDRGLRPMAGLVAQLDSDARTAATMQADPVPRAAQLQGLGVLRYRTLWATSFGALASDYIWMYDDGYSPDGSPNVDCTSSGAPGCWDHRRAILEDFGDDRELFAGTGLASEPNGMESLTAILAGAADPAPHYGYTWRDAVRHGADR